MLGFTSPFLERGIEGDSPQGVAGDSTQNIPRHRFGDLDAIHRGG
jgi:hypothetical protein